MRRSLLHVRVRAPWPRGTHRAPAAVVAQDLSNEREMTRALRDQVRSARQRCSASGSTRRPGLYYSTNGHGDGESALAAVATSCRSAAERSAVRRRSATRRRSFRRTARV
jgi:hypothetical protein